MLCPHLPCLLTLKYPPAPLAGLRCRPLRAKDSGPRKNPCISVFRRMVEHGSPAKALCCRKAPRVEQSPTPTMNRERVGKITSVVSLFHSRGRACPACVCRGCKPKDMPPQLCGPAMQAPTGKRQSFRKNRSLFCDSIVEASMARSLKPCGAARLFGWSRAPPLRWAARECV